MSPQLSMALVTCWRLMFFWSTRGNALNLPSMAASLTAPCSVLVTCREGWTPARWVGKMLTLVGCKADPRLTPTCLGSGRLWRTADVQKQQQQRHLWTGELGRPVWKAEQPWGLHTSYSLFGLDQVNDSIQSLSKLPFLIMAACGGVRRRTSTFTVGVSDIFV